MTDQTFQLPLYLPAQGAAETEATIIKWNVVEGDRFEKGQVLADVESAKAVFDFEAPCTGVVIKRFGEASDTVSYKDPILEIETADQSMKEEIPSAFDRTSSATAPQPPDSSLQPQSPIRNPQSATLEPIVIAGIGGFLPERVVTNAELLKGFPDITDDYLFSVTGIRERRWADDGVKPSDMAYEAAVQAIRKSGIATDRIDAIILATTTPDVAMPSTACIVQERLGLAGIPAFDLNAACSGWLYSVAIAVDMIRSGTARNILTVGVDMQSRLLDVSDRDTYFIFGDGAGAAIISSELSGHRIEQKLLRADPKGIRMARREEPGYIVSNGLDGVDPWIRLEGHALFRLATENFADVIHKISEKSQWKLDEMRWIVPHQANGRILKAAAKRSGLAFDRFYLNIERIGNTSSASIPLALLEIESGLRTGDKLILCAIGAGVTIAAISVEW